MPDYLDSPADSSTSHKAATLSHDRRHRRSSSFPFIKSLNPFKRKTSPTPRCPEESPAEPYEVAPGIWSTDATAKVFGYLNTEKDRHKKRNRSAGPDERNRSRNRSAREKEGGCSPARKLYERYKEAHTDDGFDDFRGRTHRRKVEEWDRKRQDRRDEARKEREESEARGRRGRMLTVSKDDELVSRGANPRTGVVTPWEGSEVSGEGGGSWLSRGRGDMLRPGKSRESSGKWTQEESGWSLVQDPGSGPARPGERGKPVRAVSVKELEDKFVINMPGVDDPDPPGVTAEQIRFYQEGVERADRKAGGSRGLVDPETLLTPRTKTPEGPSTPPSKLQKIRRKEVGSAMSERNDSTDTVLVNRQSTVAAATSLPFRNDIRETPTVKVVPPSSSASPAPKRPDRDHRGQLLDHIHTQRPFLGPRPDDKISPIANVTPSRYALNTPPKPSPLRQMEPDPEEATLAPQQLFRTLSQYLPPLSFLHPSYFANLPASYRKSTPRPPENPKKQPKGQHASTTTITITTATEKKPRPRLGRLDGANSVPRVNLRVFEGQRKWWEQWKKPSETKRGEEERDRPQIINTSPAAQRVQVELPPAKQHWKKEGKYNGWVVSDPSAEDPKAPIPDEEIGGTWKGKKSTSTCMCMKCRTRHARGSKVMQTTGRNLEPRSGITTGEQVRKNKGGDGVGCIRTDDGRDDGTVCDGNDGRPSGLRTRALAHERRRKAEAPEAPELEVPLDGDHAWFAFAGRWGDDSRKGEVACVYDGEEEEEKKEGKNDVDGDEGVEERVESALATTVVETWSAACGMEKRLRASSTARRVSMRLFGMVQHVLTTLHPASPALKMLWKKDARVEDYVHAVRDLLLAGVYLLVLLSITMTVGKVVRVSVKVLLCAWWPIKAALVVVRWFTLG